MTEKDFSKLVEETDLKNAVEKLIMEYMPVKGELNEPVTSAMEYAITAGGKRLRPVIMYLTYKALYGDEDIILPYMAAIEMIHTYSLIHDDLPALDNDELRRGRKTCHIVYGEDMAILAGDSLLNLGFETAAKSFLVSSGDIRCEKAFITFAKSSGINGMAGGQVRDVYLTGKPIDEEALKYIYENKTGALLMASMIVPAQLAGVEEDVIERIREIAYDIGMAFQVQDDILDITSTEDVLGKPVGSDEKNQKYTYATIYGIDKAKEYVKEKTTEALAILDEVFDSNDYSKKLKELLWSLVDREM